MVNNLSGSGPHEGQSVNHSQGESGAESGDRFPICSCRERAGPREGGWWGGGECSATRGRCTPNIPAAAECTQKSEEPRRVTTKDFSRGRAGPGCHLQPCWVLPTAANCLPRRKKPGI